MIRRAIAVGALALAPLAVAIPAHASYWPSSTVYVADHTGAQSGVFHVADAVRVWDTDPTLTVIYGYSCPAGVPCVNVYTQDNAPAGEVLQSNWLAATWVAVDSSNIIRQADIVLGAPNVDNPAINECVVIHELGHALANEPHEMTKGVSVMAAGCDAQVAAGTAYYLPSVDSAYVEQEYAPITSAPAPAPVPPTPPPAPAPKHGKAGKATPPGHAKHNN